ncbi:MAG: chromate efflux transporter [Thermomicrobiales bacterium]|nr:chromate efflux transporter [Thermomicrobiales bacterium]
MAGHCRDGEDWVGQPEIRVSSSFGERGSIGEVFRAALKLGLTSFGGPIAHLGYFREEYVVRRRWLDEHTYADLVALCQFLPGPASSQVGIGVGVMRAGPLGGLAAFLGFTLPSAIALALFAYGVDRFDVGETGWIHGLKIVAVAVVAQAVWGMGRQFCSSRVSATLAILAMLAILAVPGAFAQIAVIAAAGLIGWRFLAAPLKPASRHAPVALSRRWGIAAWVGFFGLLGVLPIIGEASPDGAADLFARFYRAGALVFGGGHVVLPLLQSETVQQGWLSDDRFLAGYGAAQAVPGPLFTFASYLGAVRTPEPNGAIGAVVALSAIFLPAFLLIFGALPFWDTLRAQPVFQKALVGINAAVVGILLAALYDPVWRSAILRPADFGLAAACLGLLMIWKLPPWVVVLVAAAGGEFLSRV